MKTNLTAGSTVPDATGRNRVMTDGYPDLEKLGVEYFSKNQRNRQTTANNSNIRSIMRCAAKLIDLSAGGEEVCELGCGPNPETLIYLRQEGFHAVGVEPIAAYVASAATFLGDPNAVVQGAAERIPLADQSQRIVICESVLEHVDSPSAVLREIYRVLKPSGLAYFYTTNRFHFSLRGLNGEFRVPFYNWLPPLWKESYIFRHLHFDPALANFTPRPAVHWFSYSDLCRVGREAGFAQFYSPLDLVDSTDSFVARSRLRRYFLGTLQRSALLRSLALLQVGNSIFMWKRSELAAGPA